MKRDMAQAIPDPHDDLLAAIAEQRLALRVPVSLSVVAHDGFRTRRGELRDLSLTGARLRFAEPVTADRRPWIWLPAGLGGRFPHPIGSEVAWTDSLSGTPTGHCQVGVQFCRFPLGGQSRLRRALAELLARVSEAAELTPPAERRNAARVPYERRVIARGAGAPLVMLGRDISSGGIRVETRRALAVGDTMQLALHVGGSIPLVVRAEVVRAIGDANWALAFRDLDPGQRGRIDAILLDQVAPHGGGAHSLLVSRVPTDDERNGEG
jgi:PilZ domain